VINSPLGVAGGWYGGGGVRGGRIVYGGGTIVSGLAPPGGCWTRAAVRRGLTREFLLESTGSGKGEIVKVER
jgi:hypothetical protein